MDRQDIALALLTAFVLLLAGVLIGTFQLWSLAGNSTVPWFCSALGLGLCLVSISSLMTQCPPSLIPIHRVTAVVIGSSITIGIGMLIDGLVYFNAYDWQTSIGEWFAFTVILVVMFWLPRIKGKNNPS